MPKRAAPQPTIGTDTRIAAFVAARPRGATVQQVVDAIGISGPTALRYLRRLRETGVIAGGEFRGDSWRQSSREGDVLRLTPPFRFRSKAPPRRR